MHTVWVEVCECVECASVNDELNERYVFRMSVSESFYHFVLAFALKSNQNERHHLCVIIYSAYVSNGNGNGGNLLPTTLHERQHPKVFTLAYMNIPLRIGPIAALRHYAKFSNENF